jgi:hypothetical protein
MFHAKGTNQPAGWQGKNAKQRKVVINNCLGISGLCEKHSGLCAKIK